MSLEWTDDLVLGVDEIDRQHRAMFDIFNRLSLACHGTELRPLMEHLDALEHLVTLHFETEKRLMVEHAYPAAELQHREHVQFASAMAEVRRMADTGGPSRQLGAMVAGSMVQWIVRHIREYDRELACHLKKMLPEPSGRSAL